MSDLTTLARVKEWLNIKPADTSQDSLLNRMITAASAFVESWLNRTFAITAYSELLDGTGGRRMGLGNYPILTVTKVQVGTQLYSPAPAPGQLGYTFDKNAITLNQACFVRDKNNVVIEYTAGYASVPADIEQAVIEMIGLRFKEKDRIGVSSKTLAGETISFSQKDMSSSTKTLLTQYKKVI